MTPTEKDKELREKLWKIFKHDSLASSRAGSPSQKTEEAINSLITADRKRVALEARIDALEYAKISPKFKIEERIEALEQELESL